MSIALSGAQPVFQTDGGMLVDIGPPHVTIEFEDPILPPLREKHIADIAEHTFQLNGIKRYWAGCDGTRCVVAGWGE
jgi:hypothetical protein